MARILSVTPAAVNQWCKGTRDVPAERCPEIERATSNLGAPVRCEELRPDVAWDVLRQQTAQVESVERGERQLPDPDLAAAHTAQA